MTVAGAAARGDEGALAAVLPASARTLWVDDAGLAEQLRHDGYDVGAADADVAVVTDAAALREAPRTPCVVVLLDGARSASADGGRLHDAAARLHAHAHVRAQVHAVRREFGRRGHRDVQALTWDYGVPLRATGAAGPAPALHRPERYPRRAVVVAGAGAVPSVLDLAADHARVAVSASRDAGSDRLVGPGGTVLLFSESGLVRVGLGRGRQQIEVPAAVLAALAEAGSSDVAARTPALLARGRAGGAHWSLEQRMPGRAATTPLSGRLLDDCVDFLVALHEVQVPAPDPAADTEPVLRTITRVSRRGDVVARLADAALDRVDGLPRGFGHGDFWHANLLVDGGRLAGVVDWDSAGGQRLPFLDVMHLQTTQTLRPGGHTLGRAVVETLLPWVDRGGDPQAERYAAALGLSPSRELLRALAVVYWLDWLDYQLTHYAVRTTEPRWVRGNIDLVADALSGSFR